MDDSRRCTAKAHGHGGQCKKAAILGASVCRAHGGAAPQVKRKAAERLADLIDPDRALRQAAVVAYMDITQLYNDDGSIKPMKEWPKELRTVVTSIETLKHNETAGDRVQEKVLRIRTRDPDKNLNMLFQHLGLLKERIEHSGTLTIVSELEG